MKCPICGTSGSSVISTRGWQSDTMLQRRRECFNGHRYTTYEVSDRLAKTLAKHSATSAAAIQKRGSQWKRDQRIMRAIKGGKLLSEVAAEFGLASNTVSWIVKRVDPEFNARSHGQRVKIERAAKKQGQ